MYIYICVFWVEDVSHLFSIDVYNANFEEYFAFTRMINWRPKTIKFPENQSRASTSVIYNQKNCHSLDKFHSVFQEKLSGKKK
jgi:hypothetical protein